MLKKLLTLSLMFVLASSFLVAQNTNILKPNGDLIKVVDGKDFKEAMRAKTMINGMGQKSQNVFMDSYLDLQGTLDTLRYTGAMNTNFGFFDGNVMMQYFVAPADLIIKGAGFSCSDAEGAVNATVSVRLLKLNWTWEQLTGVPAPMNMGTYLEDGDGMGGIDPFGENATSNWMDYSTDNAYPLPPWADNVDPAANTWDYDLWSDGGFGWPITAVLQDAGGNYQWVDMIDLGYEPTINAGEVFAVALVHDGTNPAFEDRVGFFSDNTLGIPGWKYYEEGRLAPQDGWYTRLYTWDFAVAVDLVGDRPPVIASYDKLPTTLDQGIQTVNAVITDDNPSGGDAGVASATLSYSLDDGTTWTDVAMSGTEPNFTADIPGQVPGTSITYKINAVDVGGLAALETSPHNYRIFQVVNTSALLVFNGFSGDGGYPIAYYFGVDDFVGYSTRDWPHDTWGFGALTEELINQYDNIIEIATNGIVDDNTALITAWLAADPARNYMLAGDEFLGSLYGWPGWDAPFTVPDGDFSKDVLGVATYYSDINVSSTESTDVSAVEGSALGGALYTAYMQRQADSGFTGSILYDPNYEIGVSNWLDGVDFVDGVEVDMNGVASDSATVLPIAGHRTLDAGNKVAFLAYDPLSLNQGGDEYYWWGFSATSPQNQVLDWFNIGTGVSELNNTVPNNFELSQNYPNPFNPSTSIQFAVPEKGLVTMRIYNILGQEVAQLFSKNLGAGSYSVDFDASQLSSGMYVYSLQSGNFEISKKMMLLK